MKYKTKSIYKITNNINHKIYIGQSVNPIERFRHHCLPSAAKDNSLIDKAIQKYGKENFTLEIIEKDIENYNEREQYWISYYTCLAPRGYNILRGGQEPPHYKGNKSTNHRITQEIVDLIIADLKNYKIPRKTIVKKYSITHDIIRHINDGSSWKKEGEHYPLRPEEKVLNDIIVENIIKDIILTNIPLNQIGAKYGWCRSSAKMINQGNNHFHENLIYPLRNHQEENKAILNL